MNERRLHLALRRERLIGRSRLLRQDIAAQSTVLDPVLHLGDRLREALAWVRTHPQILAASVVGFALVRPRRAWRWSLRLWGVWRLAASLRRKLDGR